MPQRHLYYYKAYGWSKHDLISHYGIYNRLQSGRSGYTGTLSALGLLLCCVYTGDEGEALIGVTMDTTAVARERITSIVEWFVSYSHDICDCIV